VAGPVVGGLLCELINWRAIFYLNAPFCLVAIGATLRCGERRAEHARASIRVAWPCRAVALAAITFALIQAPVLGWRTPAIVTALAVGMAAACALIAFERRVAEPMLPPQTVRVASLRGIGRRRVPADLCLFRHAVRAARCLAGARR